jgi:dihydrolipoamide dehydrogenase
MPTDTHLVVIGAGPGGYTAAIRGAQKGLEVTLIERETVGGVCLNHGCIPAKALIHAAGFQKNIAHWNDLGIETGEIDVDFQAIQEWKNTVIDTLDQQVLDSLDHHGVDFIEGTARFEDSNTIHVEQATTKQTIEFDNAIIATGSQPLEIPGLEFDQDQVISSREILQVDDVPDEIVVVGGGYIGMEAVTKFSKFGADVTIVEALDRVLAQFEDEIVDSIQETSEMYSDNIYTSALAQRVEYEDEKVVLVAEQDGEELRLSGDYIIVAAGREPNTAYETLQLDNTDVDLTDKGFIAVDDQLRTTDEHIFCVGDAAGPSYLAHIAYREGKVAAAVAAGEDAAFDNEYIPAVMYTDPEVAVVGLSESEAREAHDEILVGKFPLSASGRALTTDEPAGYVKVIADVDEQLLGVRIVGARASDSIAEATLALELEASLDDLATTLHAHPTFPEALSEAAEAAKGESIHSH